MLWYPWVLIIAMFEVNCILRLQLSRTGQTSVKKSQIMSYGQLQVKNFYNFQYYCRIDVGVPPKRADVILDTGSHHLYLPANNCTNCPYGTRKYDPSLSITAETYPKRRNKLSYGKGEVQGFQVDDKVSFQDSNTTVSFLAVDYQKDTENSQADGLMGLSNYKRVNNIFDVLYKESQLVSNKIAFELGVRELKQKSYFYYNLSEEDFPDAVYINASRKDYWTIPVREFKVGNQSFGSRDALVDSGTSLILMPTVLYDEFDKSVFSNFCQPYSTQMRSCLCPSQADYPNITVFSGDVAFNITPANYILGSYKNKMCKLGIDKMTGKMDFVILGDLFFHHQVIIFDKTNNRVGFINQHEQVHLYPNFNLLSTITYLLMVMALLSIVMILGMRNHKKKDESKAQLFEPFTGKSVELASGADCQH